MIFEINEIFEYIQASYLEYISMNRGERYAVARIFDEYDVFEDDSEAVMEDMITMLAIGEMIVNNDCIFIKTIERLKKTYGNIQLFIEIVKDQITESELKELLMRVKNVEAALNTVTVTYNPNY